MRPQGGSFSQTLVCENRALDGGREVGRAGGWLAVMWGAGVDMK